MMNARIARNMVLFILSILCCFVPVPGYSAPQQPKPSPTAVKQVPSLPAAQQVPFFVRGTVTTNDGKGVQGIEVSLIQVVEGGRAIPLDKKMTDSAGNYGFTVLPDKKGKELKIVPRFLQQCCQGCCAFWPEVKGFTLQNSVTADFKLNLPAPDTSISLLTMDPNVQGANYYQTILYEFEIKNKGYLPTAKSSFNLSFAQPCCPENCINEQEVPVIPAQGNKKISIVKKRNSGARGCPFTATVSPQKNEVKIDDNKVTGISPNVKVTLIDVFIEGNTVSVQNKGTSTPTVEITWYCDDKNCDGRCSCPALAPTTASAPAFPQMKNLEKVTKGATLAPNEKWVYPIPTRLPEWGSIGGSFTATVSANVEHNSHSVYVNFK